MSLRCLYPLVATEFDPSEDNDVFEPEWGTEEAEWAAESELDPDHPTPYAENEEDDEDEEDWFDDEADDDDDDSEDDEEWLDDEDDWEDDDDDDDWEDDDDDEDD